MSFFQMSQELLLFRFSGRAFPVERFGFKKLNHLHGGIDAWATDVDPDMARY